MTLKQFALGALLATAATAALADDPPHYRAQCKGSDTRVVKFDYWCDVTVAPETPDAKVIVFTVKPPGEAPAIVIRSLRNRSGTVDGVPAKERGVLKDWFHWVTTNGDDIRFTKPPAGIEY